MQTLTLNAEWDIYTDEAGNIAISKDEYATAQSAANAIRLFTNDAYFDQNKGIPHFSIELGKPFETSEAVLINRIRNAAMEVDGVTDCRVKLETDGGRVLGGEAYVTTGGGDVAISI